jgi:hypothetical protein
VGPGDAARSVAAEEGPSGKREEERERVIVGSRGNLNLISKIQNSFKLDLIQT